MTRYYGFVLRDTHSISPSLRPAVILTSRPPNLDMPKLDHYLIFVASAIGPFENIKFHFALAEAPRLDAISYYEYRLLGVRGTINFIHTKNSPRQNATI